MTTTLSEGVKVPDVGSVNWAGDLEINWNLLNGALANLSFNVKLDRDNTWTGEQTFSLPIVGSITGTASKAIADEDGTSIKTGYVNVAGNQTVSGDKSWTGSNAFNNILPNATNSYSLGSSSYQWSSVYAQTYYYNGTEFSNKFVTTDTSQSISGQKTFNANLVCTSSIYTRNGNYTSGTVPTSSMIAMNRFVDKNNLDIGYTRAVIRADGSTEAELRVLNRFTNGALDPAGSAISSMLVVGISSTGSTYVQFNGRLHNGLIPTTSGSYDCGTSTNKWKTLNGINPGALSLPDVSVSVVVDTTDWVYDGLTANLIKFNNAVQTFSGWLYITAQNTSASDRIVVRYIGSDASNLTFIGGKFDGASSIFVACPIVAGVSTYVWSTKALNTIKIYKAQGNV